MGTPSILVGLHDRVAKPGGQVGRAVQVVVLVTIDRRAGYLVPLGLRKARMRNSTDADFKIVPFAPSLADDLAKLFASDPSSNTCWCMWFITSVKDYQAAGPAGNREKFESLTLQSQEPLGLLAYHHGETVAWCAVGPRERFARAVKTPTLKVHVASDGEAAWFVPCFFVRADHRRSGVTRALLERAASLAAEHGARVIEGFPFAGDRPGSSGDRQVGTEGVFTASGFSPKHRPSNNRVVMQRRLSKQ